jgi:RNase P subunit RPR2
MRSSSTDHAMPPGFVQLCPRCKTVMGVKSIVPIMFDEGVDAVAYRCAACGTEMEQTIERGRSI